MEKEIWKPVVGYEGFYEVSNFGNVKGLSRRVSHPKSGYLNIKSKPLTNVMKSIGYYQVELNNQVAKNKLVHRLVAESFIPNPDNKPQVNHIDGNKSNNHVSNLEWCTSKENAKHAYDTGLKPRGDNHYNSILTNEKVKAIKRLLRLKPKTHRYNLSKKVGVTNGVIYQIINNVSWRHVKI